MRSIFVIFCNLLLLSSCLSANIDRESRDQNKSENRTQVGALNEDFQYALFDTSDLSQTLQIAKDPQFTEFVQKHIFPVKYHNYKFQIIAYEEENEDGGNEDALERSLRIYGYDFIMDVIKYFGASIPSLSIYGSTAFSDEQSATFHHYVNEYCAESLTHISMDQMKENTFTQFQKPFSQLTEMHLCINTKQSEPVRPFGELFPKLQKLTLIFRNSALDNETNKFIENKMEHLVDLKFTISTNDRSAFASVHQQIANMIKKNPQIRTITYSNSIEDFITEINENLVNLENLIIQNIYPKNQSIHFDHVKSLTLRIGASDMAIDKLTFSQLDTVNMIRSVWDYTGSERDCWINFFKNHQNIKNFHCEVFRFDGLVEFLADLPNLDTIRMQSFYVNIDVEVLSRLIDDHEHLSTFDYQLHSSVNRTESDLSTYLETFGDKWHITHYIEGTWLGLTLKKKN